MKKVLRWIATPLAFVAVFLIAYFIGKIIFNWTTAGTGLFYIKNELVQNSIVGMCEFVSHIVGTTGAMMAVLMVAPNKKVVAAKTIATFFAIAITALYLMILIFNIDIEMRSIAGWIGIIVGTVAGYYIANGMKEDLE